MVASSLLLDDSKILNSKLYPVNSVDILQIGKLYIVINSSYEYGKNNIPDRNKYDIIKIISVTPKLDETKISNTLTYDSLMKNMNDDMYFDDDVKNNGCSNNENFYKFDHCYNRLCKAGKNSTPLKYGWLYCEVEYMNILSNITYKRKVIYGRTDYIEHIYFVDCDKPFPSKNQHHNFQDRLYMSDAFEYDTHDIDNNNFEYDLNLQLINDVNKIKETTVYDIIIRNFRYFLAQTMLSNVDVIDDKDTIQIDNLTWYNGFYKSEGGINGRSYLFYDYIPKGWRLPTITELSSMLDKHPLLRKELNSSDKTEIGAVRNNAGMECHYKKYINRYNDIYVMVYDSNDYSDENCYFPCEIKAVDIEKYNVVNLSPVEKSTHYYRPYLIMLVKMTDDEIKKQNDWMNHILKNQSLYDNIDDIYRKYGIENIDDIESIDFDMCIDGVKKSFKKEKSNHYIDALKEVLSKYTGNNDVYNASKIQISIKNNDDKQISSLNFDTSVQCNIYDFLLKVSPLLCRDLCMHNINTVDELTYTYDKWDWSGTTYGVYGTGHFKHIKEKYNGLNIPIDMYFYVLNALNLIGINYNTLAYDTERDDEEYRNFICPEEDRGSLYDKHKYRYNGQLEYRRAATAYMMKMILHLSNGKDVIIKDLPIECFNQSELYLQEIANDSDYSDNVKAFKKNLFKRIQ